MSELTVTQAAEKLGVKPKQVRAFIASGDLLAWVATVKQHTTRPRYRINSDDLEAFKIGRQTWTKPKPEARRSIAVPKMRL